MIFYPLGDVVGKGLIGEIVIDIEITEYLLEGEEEERHLCRLQSFTSPKEVK
jgi:hypothetical protein